VAAPIAYFISFEVSDPIDPFRWLGSLATLRHWARVAVIGMKAVIYVTPEVLGTMKPRSGANEDAPSKPL
jgi:hypothetical protein